MKSNSNFVALAILRPVDDGLFLETPGARIRPEKLISHTHGQRRLYNRQPVCFLQSVFNPPLSWKELVHNLTTRRVYSHGG